MRKVRISLPCSGIVLGILIGVLITFLLFNYLVIPFKVAGASMVPSLIPNQRILVNSVSSVRDIRRFDMVVLSRPDKPDELVIKRIIGLPGEKIRLDNRQIYIDFQMLAADPVRDGGVIQKRPFSDLTMKIPGGHYFVLGDNRSGSLDSRLFGPVPGSCIRGKAVFSYWPPERFGFL